MLSIESSSAKLINDKDFELHLILILEKILF